MRDEPEQIASETPPSIPEEAPPPVREQDDTVDREISRKTRRSLLVGGLAAESVQRPPSFV